MKVYMRIVDMIASFNKEGVPTPIRFKIFMDRETHVINIDKIMLRQEEKLAGNKMIIYKCQSLINGIEKIYELKYELATCKWFLFKM